MATVDIVPTKFETFEKYTEEELKGKTIYYYNRFYVSIYIIGHKPFYLDIEGFTTSPLAESVENGYKGSSTLRGVRKEDFEKLDEDVKEIIKKYAKFKELQYDPDRFDIEIMNNTYDKEKGQSVIFTISVRSSNCCTEDPQIASKYNSVAVHY